MSWKGSKAGEMEELYSDYVSCTLCPLHNNRCGIVRGGGNTDAKVAVVIDKISQEDANSAYILTSGYDAMMLGDFLQRHGVAPEDIWATPTTLCPAKDFKSPKAADLGKCSARLRKELHIVQPRVVVATGAASMRALVPRNPPAVDTYAGHAFEATIDGELVSYPATVLLTHSITGLLRNPDFSDVDGRWVSFYEHIGMAIKLADRLEEMYDDSSKAEG